MSDDPRPALGPDEPSTVAPSVMSAPTATTEPVEPDPGWKRRVALFLTAQTISLFGSNIVQYAIMWHLTLTLKQGWVMGLYALVAFVPQAIVSLAGGTLADRTNRRTVIVVSDTLIALVTLALAVSMSLGRASLALILVAVAVRSVGQGFQQPAVSALLPQLTPAAHLMRVNGINQTVTSAMMLLSPIVAGAVYAWGGLVPTFWIDVVTAFVGVAIVLTIPVATIRSGAAKGASFVQDFAAGIRYVRSHRVVAWLLVLFTVIYLLVVAPTFLDPLFITRSFTPEVWALTGIEVAFSAGMGIGGILVATLAAKWHQGRMLMVSCLSFGLLGAAFGLTPLLGRTIGLYTMFAIMVVVAIAIPFFSAPVMTLVATTVEPEFMGRVSSLMSIVAVLAMPAGMTVLGPLADRVPIEWIFIATGLAAFVFTIAAFAAAPGRYVLSLSGGGASAGDEGGRGSADSDGAR